MVADILKGWLAVVVAARLCWHWFHLPQDPADPETLAIIAALGAVVGHNYTCWLNFKGGKGISTSAGVLLALVPWSLLIILSVFLVVLTTSRYVSLASISASCTLPFATWFTGKSNTLIIITSIMAVLAIFKHRANIQRLLNGSENKIGGKKPPASGSVQAPP
jgi:acyl phosphate:glycerol-3-phosphate acyltransferase